MRKSKVVLTDEQTTEIMEKYKNGIKPAQLMKDYNINYPFLNGLLKKKGLLTNKKPIKVKVNKFSTEEIKKPIIEDSSKSEIKLLKLEIESLKEQLACAKVILKTYL